MLFRLLGGFFRGLIRFWRFCRFGGIILRPPKQIALFVFREQLTLLAIEDVSVLKVHLLGSSLQFLSDRLGHIFGLLQRVPFYELIGEPLGPFAVGKGLAVLFSTGDGLHDLPCKSNGTTHLFVVLLGYLAHIQFSLQDSL